ncbi:MAG: TonB-dependent receptor [Myxococcales bacterium]|nr:TonB-dependent receptor [Myxococcales bacterium]
MARFSRVVIAVAALSLAAAPAAAQSDDPPPAEEPAAPAPEPSEGSEPPEAPEAEAPEAEAPEAEAPEAEAESPEAPAEHPPAADAAQSPAEPSPEASTAAPEASLDLGAALPEDSGEADESEHAGDGSIEEIVVTGSRIKRRSAFSTASPVQIVDRKELEVSGAENLADVIRYLSVNSGSTQSIATGTGGVQQFNLRGLGPQATLVLVNGRRMVPTGAGAGGGGGFVDVGTIPIAMVERIEILKGGASAIYGSDAIAGVVNIITRRKFDGVRVEARGVSMDSFEQMDGDISLAAGKTFDGGGIVGGATYYVRQPLMIEDLPWAQEFDVSQFGHPASFAWVGPVGQRIYETSGLGAQRVVLPDPACGEPGSQSFLGPASPTTNNQFCYTNAHPNALFGSERRISAYVTGDLDLSDHTLAFTELMASVDEQRQRVAPSFGVLTRPVFASLSGNPHADAPDYLPQGGGYPPTLGVAYIGRPAGGNIGKNRFIENDSHTLRAVVGLRGDLQDAMANTIAEDWEWELAGTWSRTNYTINAPDTLETEFRASLGIPEALDELGIMDNPCAPSLSADERVAAGCYNPFYLSERSDAELAIIDGFSDVMVLDTDSTLIMGDAQLGGPLFELPGGDVSFALGHQIRYEERVLDAGALAEAEAFSFVLGNTSNRNDRLVNSPYLEFAIPLINGLEVELAARLEAYSEFDPELREKIGLTLGLGELFGSNEKIWRRLILRGVWTRAFRAPNLFQTAEESLATAPTGFTSSSGDTAFAAARVRGNAGLKAEEATAISGGFQWLPIDQLALSFDYYFYEYENQIAPENGAGFYRDFTQCIEDQSGPGGDLESCRDDRVVTSDGTITGTLQAVEVQWINAPKVQTQGIDLGGQLTINQDLLGTGSDFGAFTIGGQGTYILEFLAIDEDGEEFEAAGHNNALNFVRPMPRFRSNFMAGYRYSDHSLSATVRYIGEVEDDDAINVVGIEHTMPAWVTLDLQYTLSLPDLIGSLTEVRVGVRNVGDVAPPLSYSGGISSYDPRGRLLFAGLTQEF